SVLKNFLAVLLHLFGGLTLADDPIAGTNQRWRKPLQPFAIARVLVVVGEAIEHGSHTIHPVRELALFPRIQPASLPIESRLVFFPSTFFECYRATDHSVRIFEVSMRGELTLDLQEVLQTLAGVVVIADRIPMLGKLHHLPRPYSLKSLNQQAVVFVG